MSRARIRIDATPAVALAYCSCGWRELAATREGAQRVACWHEEQVHPETHTARRTAMKQRSRTRMSTPPRDNGEHGSA